MSRAGVRGDHAERCLGRLMPGVRAVYDPYEYLEEKRDAFNKLAAVIKGTVHPSEAAAWPAAQNVFCIPASAEQLDPVIKGRFEPSSAHRYER